MEEEKSLSTTTTTTTPKKPSSSKRLASVAFEQQQEPNNNNKKPHPTTTPKKNKKSKTNSNESLEEKDPKTTASRVYDIRVSHNDLPTMSKENIFSALSNDQTHFLTGKISMLKTLTVGDYVQKEKNNFVKALLIFLPPNNQEYAHRIASVAPDEFLMTIQQKILPRKYNLDTVLYHIFGMYGLEKVDLGGAEKNPQLAEKRFAVIKKYLSVFCQLAERLLSSNGVGGNKKDEKTSPTTIIQVGEASKQQQQHQTSTEKSSPPKTDFIDMM